MSTKKEDWQLARAELIDGIRTLAGYELRKQKRRLLNEVEHAALARFDRAVIAGEDYEYVVADVLNGGVTIRGELA